MADNSDLQKIQASEKPTSDDFEYAYVETVNKAFVRIAKERLKEILGANRYTNEEIDQKLSTIPKFNIEVVSSLPTTDISETTIYLVSSGDDSENLYTEYININGLWEILGTQKSTFSGSAKDVTYDDTETKLGATNVQDAFGKLSATVNDLKQNGTGSGVTTSMSESLWAIVQKTAFAEQLTDEELNAFKTAWGITEEEPDEPIEPDVPEVTLSSISATYNGGNVLVGTSVNSLTGITVKAHYSDGTSKTVADYTLSGTIAEGNNTITVSYDGKTTTFTVVGYVEETESTEPIYQLGEPTTFDGTNSIDTEYDLLDVDKNWSMAIDFTPTSRSSNMAMFSVGAYYNEGIAIGCRGAWFWDVYCGNKYVDISTKLNESIKTVITHEKDSNEITIYYINNDSNEFTSSILSYGEKTSALIGASKREKLVLGNDYNSTSPGFVGTISAFEVYERILDTSEINTFLSVMKEDYITPPLTLPTDDLVAGYVGNNGVVTALANSYIVNKYIKVTPNASYSIDVSNLISDKADEYQTDTIIRYALYDSEKAFISRSNETLSTTTKSKTITIPSTAQYIMVAVGSDYMTDMDLAKYVIERITIKGV